MNSTMNDHPTDEALIECALEESDGKLRVHIEQCPQCSDYIEEIRTVSRDIAAIEDEPVPERLATKILAIAHGKRPENYVMTFLQTWHKNPFLIGCATAGAILLLYALLSLHL
ncbi:MAG: hypothetical protein JXA18_08285 [Chitinispirillaceae bacterium]|nr:hypothetical protein [Chitinispirillaceae bacterium]